MKNNPPNQPTPINKTEEKIRSLINHGYNNIETLWNLTGDTYAIELNALAQTLNDLAAIALSQHDELIELINLINSNKINHSHQK